MAGALRLEPRLGQSPVVAPRVRQAIGLLRLSGLELREWAEREIERNPLLERAEPEPESPGESPGDPYVDSLAGVDSFAGGGVAREGGAASFDGAADSLAEPATLRRSLEEQVGVDAADPAERAICGHLIDSLDDAGYLTDDLVAIAARLGCSEDRVARALARVQACEPVGVGARSLRECLALQLAERGRLDGPMERLLDNLDLLARRDLAGLATRCGVGEDEAAARAREIRALDPKPGATFDGAAAPAIVPDVLVRARGGGWAVSLNAAAAPRLAVDRRYRALPGRRGGADAAWIRERLQSADWIVRALERRAESILKVSLELVRRQDGFLRHGVHRLEPLTLREVADRVGLHESTVSRVTSGKFAAAPRGVFALRRFFSAALPSADGGARHAAESVRQRIRALIDGECAKRTLSDERLVALLRESGVDIARRTVAKYRESMNIPSSFARRRRKDARL